MCGKFMRRIRENIFYEKVSPKVQFSSPQINNWSLFRNQILCGKFYDRYLILNINIMGQAAQKL
jgi:hypothetical protein